MGLVEHAKLELKMAGLFDEDSDYNGDIGKAALELIEVFAKQGHSGMSAPYVASIFNKLSKFEPLIPITGKDEEWSDVRDYGKGEPWYQNKRCSALFKDGKDGRPYYIDAIVKRDQNGNCWSGRAWLSEEDWLNGDRSKMVDKRGYIKGFPFTPKTFYIDVYREIYDYDKHGGEEDVRIIGTSSGNYVYFIKDRTQLDEVFTYFDKK